MFDKYKNILCVKQYAVITNDFNYRHLDSRPVKMQETYMADLILCFNDDGIEVLKDRYGQKRKIEFENENEWAKFLLLL